MLPSFRQIQADRDLARKRREERQRRQRAKAKRKSLLEKLEDRRLLAALTVTNENDSGEGSLRAAIETANSNNEADTITFAASVPSVALTADTIRLKRDFGQGRTYKTVIEGPGKIIVGDSQLLVEQYADVEFRNLDVTGATNIAVRNFGTTHITRSTFYNNGTAIQQSDGTTYVTLSTISGNTERGIGATDGDLVITDTTVTANPIGIGASASYFRMYNTIVAGNTFDSDISSDSFRAFHNLIGDANHASGITNGVNGNIVGVNGTGKRDINTILDTNLKLNGGHTQTHALVVGSPALDAASIGYSHQTVDQRGEKRIHGASMDIGAYEATIAEQLHNSVDVDGLRFISSGQFQQNTQSGTTTRVSTGSIEVGLKPSLDGLFTPLLRLPSGAVITTNASGKSFLSTGGLVAAVVKDKQANLMLGRLQNENESVLIPVADLTSSNGYSIPRDHRLDVDSGEKSFSPSRVKLAHSVKVGVVVIPEHVQMSGFLQFNALDGAGVFLSGTNHFRTSENGATAVINTGSLELRDAYHQTPSRTNPISMEIAGVSLQFATATMEYDKPTQEFKLGGTALATFEGGNADIVFGSGNDPNSFIVIKDDKIQGARTTVAVAEQFTVAGLRFRRPRPSQSIAVTLNASTNTIEFNGTAIASASDDTATPSTDTASQISGEEKNALDESPGPKVENLQFSRSVAAKLVNGVMQTFDTPVEPFSIGRLGVSNAASATPDQVMQLRYYGSKRGYTIYGSNQVITQDYGIDRDGRALAETKLNVGLHAVVIPDARARRNTRVVRGDDITIKNGRFDRFRIPIRSMSLLDKVTFFSDQYLHPVNEKAHEFFADYNPASQELRIVGKARLDGKEVTAPKVDFGTLGDSGYKSETALNGNLSPYESSNATKGTIAYRIEQIIKRSPFSQFRFYNSDHRAELNFPEVNNYTLARSGALTVTHSGGGIWDEPGPPGF